MTDQKQRVYIGTYTRQASKGVYVTEFDRATGRLSEPRLAAEVVNPSFVATHDGRYLYAVGEISDYQGKSSGSVSAFRIDADTGDLTLLNQVPSGGGAPCFITADHSGRYVLTASYGDGRVAVFPIRPDGSLGEATAQVQHEGSGPDPDRQDKPHAHSIIPDPSNRFALAADLGLDQVIIYRFDDTRGTLEPHGVGITPPGTGPRHLAFHPNGRILFAINEMGGSVTTFAWDAEAGSLDPIDTVSTLPPDHTGKRTCAEVQVHPTGRFLYASNREGHDSIAIFTVDESSGRLTPSGWLPVGKEPRHFTLVPGGEWLLVAHQKADSIMACRLDLQDGSLSPVPPQVDVPSPVCLCVMP